MNYESGRLAWDGGGEEERRASVDFRTFRGPASGLVRLIAQLGPMPAAAQDEQPQSPRHSSRAPSPPPQPAPASDSHAEILNAEIRLGEISQEFPSFEGFHPLHRLIV